MTLAAGCFTGRWHHDSWSNNNGIHEDERGREGGWNSDGRNSYRDQDREGRWKDDSNSERHSQEYSREDAHL